MDFYEEGDIAVTRSNLSTPIGDLMFMTSMRMDIDFSQYTAIAHHVATGVMTMAVCPDSEGGSTRTATADAAQTLYFTLQAIHSYRLLIEATQ